MGEPAMELGNRELEQIGEYVKSHLEEWMMGIHRERELDLLERIVRVEEEIKSIHVVMDERFDAVDKRFESMQHYMDRRFSSLQWMMGIGFTLMAALMGLLDLL